jgi:WD40 repeat protein
MRSCFQSTTEFLKPVKTLLALSLLFLTIAQPIIFTSAAQTSDEIAGYVLRVGLEGMTVQSILEDGSVGHTIATLSNFTVEDHSQTQWNIFDKNGIALSPDRQKLAFAASQDGATAYLFIFDLVTGMNNQTQLSFPFGSLPALIWSPDSSKLFVDPSGNGFSRIYDVTSNQTLYIFDSLVFSPTWLPDSQRFIYNGSSVCPASCKSGSDLYLLDILGGTSQALTHIDPDALGITSQLVSGNVYIGGVIYNNSLERVFFILQEPLDIDTYEAMYSVDLLGNLSFAGDIAGLYPESVLLPTNNVEVFSDADTNAVFLVTQTDGMIFNDNEVVEFRWSVLRYDPVGELEVIYERDFLSPDGVEIITSLAVSPDGNAIAIGAVNSRDLTAGSVTVVNLQNSQEILQASVGRPVCNIYWADNDNVIYGQFDDRPCSLIRDNQPSDRLIQHTLSTNTTTTILDGQGDILYFISRYPPTPPYD